MTVTRYALPETLRPYGPTAPLHEAWSAWLRAHGVPEDSVPLPNVVAVHEPSTSTTSSTGAQASFTVEVYDRRPDGLLSIDATTSRAARRVHTGRLLRPAPFMAQPLREDAGTSAAGPVST